MAILARAVVGGSGGGLAAAQGGGRAAANEMEARGGTRTMEGEDGRGGRARKMKPVYYEKGEVTWGRRCLARGREEGTPAR